METKIIELYQQGFSIAKIGKILDLSDFKVSKTLKEHNIEVLDRQIVKFNKILPEAIEMYQKGQSLTSIAKALSINRDTLSKRLKESNIEVINRQNECKFNSAIFDNIDTPEKAYWLGFLYADGNLSSTLNNIELGLKESDKDHLEKYLLFLGIKDLSKIKFHSNKLGNSYRVTLTNKHLWETLNSLGCTPKKSFTLSFPKDIDYKLDFIRGYFDGDGCITYHRHKLTVTPSCSIISTPEFLQAIKEILAEYDIQSNIISDKRYTEHTKILKFSTNDSRKLLNTLYSNASIYLTRKYNRYLFFKEFCRSFKELDELLRSEIGEGCDANTEVN